MKSVYCLNVIRRIDNIGHWVRCMFVWGIGVVIFLSNVTLVLAQPVVGSVQPDALSVGTVRVGSTVEASFRVFGGAASDTNGLAVKTVPPPFVRVERTRLATQKFGDVDPTVVFDLFVSIDTSRAGDFNGKIKVQIGEVEVDIDVRATILEKAAGLSRVLLVETPFQRFSTGDSTIFDSWLDLVKSAKLDVEYFEVDESRSVLRDVDLAKRFDVILLSGTGLHCCRDEDFEKLRAFAAEGGRVVVSADHFMAGSVEKANKLVEPLGLKMADLESRDAQIFEIQEEAVAEHRLTKGVKMVRFHRPSPTTIENEKTGTVLLTSPLLKDAGFVAVGTVDKGEVVTLGASLWWLWISKDFAAETDNVRLLQNLLTKP